MPIDFQPDVVEDRETTAVIDFQPDDRDSVAIDFVPDQVTRGPETITGPSSRASILPPGAARSSGMQPMGRPIEAGPGGAIQAAERERLQGAPALTGAEVEEALFASPIHIPRFGEPGTATRGVSEALSGVAEGAVSLGGIAALGAATIPPLAAPVGLFFSAAAVKHASELLGEASVDKDPEKIGAGVTTAVLGLLPLKHAGSAAMDVHVPARAVAKAMREDAAVFGESKFVSDIESARAARDYNIGRRPGPSIEGLGSRVRELTDQKNVSRVSEIPVLEIPPEFYAAPRDLGWSEMLPRDIQIEASAAVRAAGERIRAARERQLELEAPKLTESGAEFRSVAETPGFLQTAEQRIGQRPLPEEPTRFVEVIDESTPLKTAEDILRQKLETRDWVDAVAVLGQMKPEIRPKMIEKLLGIGEEAVPLSSAEKITFEAIWDKVLTEKLAEPTKPKAEATTEAIAPKAVEAVRQQTKSLGESDIITKLENAKIKGDYGKSSANPFPEIGTAIWNTSLDIAIAAVKAGRTVESAIREAIDYLKKNARGYDEAQVRSFMERIIHQETKPRPVTPRPATGSLPAPAPGRTRPLNADLADVYKIFEPPKKERKSVRQVVKDTVEATRTGFSSKFRPLDRVVDDINAYYGVEAPRKAGIFEALKGSTGRAEADVFRFDRDVSSLVKGQEKDFSAYMFLKRSLDRLRQDEMDIALEKASPGSVKKLNRRAVSDYTILELEAKLATLESQLTPEQKAAFEKAAAEYQRYMDDALKLQVSSGRMSQEVYDAIKAENQFYAPFKVLKYFEKDTQQHPGMGSRIDTAAEYTKAMEGIKDADFKLGEMLPAARINIRASRIMADKHRAMQEFASVAAFDTQGLFIRRLKPNEEPKSGKATVNVFENGQRIRYEVDPDVAKALDIYSPAAQRNLVMAAALVPFKAGAIGWNVAFQIANTAADTPRAALVSKYGIKGVADIYRYPLGYIHSMYSAIRGNLFENPNKLYLDFLESGVAGGTIQESLAPWATRFQQSPRLQQNAHLAKSVLTSFSRLTTAIEESNKILGLKRAMKEHGVSTGSELFQMHPDAITELRRFSGSPDFGRMGAVIENYGLNVAVPFLNARIQGTVADLGRLTGRDSGKVAAKTWRNLAIGVGIPTSIIYAFNQIPQNQADYDKIPEREKQNYWHIPKDKYITLENGEIIRDYWRIPKRETAKWMANMVEASLDFAKKRDAEGTKQWLMSLIEEIVPVNIQGRTAREKLESVGSGLNPVIKGPIELATGRDMWRHRDIIPGELMKTGSPKNQFTDRTPKVFIELAEKMPGWEFTEDVLKSPMMMEHMTRTFTAGLITQFLPKTPPTGREGFETWPILQRFQAALYVDQSALQEEIDDLKREDADTYLERHKLAQKVMRDHPVIQDALEAVTKMPTGDSKLAQHIVNLHTAKMNGVNSKDRQLLGLSASQRAEFMKRRLVEMTPEQQQSQYAEWSNKGLLTRPVIEELARIMPPVK